MKSSVENYGTANFTAFCCKWSITIILLLSTGYSIFVFMVLNQFSVTAFNSRKFCRLKSILIFVRNGNWKPIERPAADEISERFEKSNRIEAHGLCLTIAIWRRRNPLRQWQRSFQITAPCLSSQKVPWVAIIVCTIGGRVHLQVWRKFKIPVCIQLHSLNPLVEQLYHSLNKWDFD